MDDAKSLLADLIQPTRQLVALAKAHILAPEVPSKFDGDPESLRFARTQGPPDPSQARSLTVREAAPWTTTASRERVQSNIAR